jgi:hypothetical protein
MKPIYSAGKFAGEDGWSIENRKNWAILGPVGNGTQGELGKLALSKHGSAQ